MGGSKNRFPKSHRVRRQSDFDRVYAGNYFAADDVLVVLGSANGREISRLGLSISKRVGNAVVRNRWKRLIREAFRQQPVDIPAGLDMVVRPRRGAQPSMVAIRRSLPRLARRLVRRIGSER